MIKLKKFTRKYSLTTLLFFLFAISVSAQYNKSDFWDNLSFGGGFGLGIGNNSFNIALSPSAIYQVSEDFATGLSLNANYSKFGDSDFLAYGPSVINLYNPFPSIQLSGEFEQWRVNVNQNNFSENYWYSALFLGLGYTQRNITIGLRYDVLYDEDRSFYADPLVPFVRVYF